MTRTPLQTRISGLFGESRAIFSNCGLYRYWLYREWDAEKPRVVFLMLNPSTADESVNDPTVRRCLGYAQDWGFGSLGVLNLFALRSTAPSALLTCDDPVGASNDEWLRNGTAAAGRIVLAWGAVHKKLSWRAADVLKILRRDGGPLYCLGKTKDGQPRHPLYLRRDLGCVLF